MLFHLSLYLARQKKNPNLTSLLRSPMAGARSRAPSPLILLLLISITISISSTLKVQGRLYTDFYKKSCPRFEQIMVDTVTSKQINSPSTAAGTLRLLFHDCLHTGCDASVLVSSTAFNTAERDADINLSLPGDAFDVVVRAKTALELACPNTVSCADILAVAARNLLVMVGGPGYPVALGRRDARSSRAAAVEGNLPRPSMPVSELLRIFAARGFSAREMVALTGAHTVGFSHCKEFSGRIYNSTRADPHYNPRFADALRSACSDYHNNPTLSVFNDIMSPNKFDNLYYQNLPKGLGLLESDHALNQDARTRPFVELYAKDQSLFFADFAKAMQKLSSYGVQTGRRGEIRHRCDAVN